MLPQLPEDVSLLLSTLNNHGYEAYIVGGCVRDSLMGRTPHDWDLTTSATPE
ncbi:MAG TPA: polynucleotide adenylyltransferase, partial [Firmicutes bacterium]|nr:polynucleotide adenylyltransferase [Bacillota bacterium]